MVIVPYLTQYAQNKKQKNNPQQKKQQQKDS